MSTVGESGCGGGEGGGGGDGGGEEVVESAAVVLGEDEGFEVCGGDRRR